MKNDENLVEYENTINGLLYLIEEHEEKQINQGILYTWNVEIQNILEYDKMISKEYENIYYKNKEAYYKNKNLDIYFEKDKLLQLDLIYSREIIYEDACYRYYNKKHEEQKKILDENKRKEASYPKYKNKSGTCSFCRCDDALKMKYVLRKDTYYYTCNNCE